MKKQLSFAIDPLYPLLMLKSLLDACESLNIYFLRVGNIYPGFKKIQPKFMEIREIVEDCFEDLEKILTEMEHEEE